MKPAFPSASLFLPSLRPVLLLFLLLVSSFLPLAALEGEAVPGLLSLKIFPETAAVSLQGRVLVPESRGGVAGEIRRYRLPVPEASLVLTAPGHRPAVLRVAVPPEGAFLEEKLEPAGTGLRFLRQVPTGSQPKSVEFFGDRGLLAVALLNGTGVEFFDGTDGRLVKKTVIPEPWGSQRGFVETVYLSGRKEIWVSQMDTRSVHVIDAVSLEYLRTLPSGGLWTKILAATPDEKYVYASNWLTENLGVISTATGELERTIPLSGIPRGLVFSRDGRRLYVCIYETGNIEEIDTVSGRSVRIFPTGPGAARHAVPDPSGRYLYVSDMWHGTVYRLDLSTGRVTDRIRIGPNLNTIKLSPDGRYLYISSRGRNNPETYLVKGPDFGTVTVLDTRSFRIVDRVWGKNQPTGLALSPDGRTLVFTDFLSDQLEFYDTGAFIASEEAAD